MIEAAVGAFCALALAGLLAACRHRPVSDEGPWRRDERARGRTCPHRSLWSEHLCTRAPGHRGPHDVEPRADLSLLVGSARR